jgi:serine/threonine protein kinase/WD40 repeat protein
MTPTPSTSDSSVPELLKCFEQELIEAPDPDALLERYRELYPELAETFRELAVAIEMLHATPFQHAPAPGSVRADGASPTRFGPYRVIRSIGRGGMGEVFEAVEEPLGRKVAVKTIRRSQATSPSLLLRFDRERRTLARLHHTNIVPIFATGREEDLLYFAMPYLSGASLGQVIETARSHRSSGSGLSSSSFEELLKEAHSRSQSASEAPIVGGREVPGTTPPEEPVPMVSESQMGAVSSTPARAAGSQLLSRAYIRTVVQVMATVAEGLHHAHEARVIHRDLKPSNIMVETGGHAWVLDFGLAALNASEVDGPTTLLSTPAGPESDGTLTAGPLGTPRYMAPEQHRDGKQADIRSDVWGLGVTLYELLTLQRAFVTGQSVLDTEPIPPRRLNPGLDRDLEAVVLKSLRKDPEHRYQTAQALADDLNHWLHREPVSVRPAALPRRFWLWSQRRPGAGAAVGIATAALVALAVGGVVLGNQIAVAAEARTRAAEGERDAAIERERIQRREALIQEIQKIRMTSHRGGWRREVESRITRAAGLSDEKGPLQRQAIGALRELDAEAIKDLPHPASSLTFDPSGRRIYSTWFKDRAVRVWNREAPNPPRLLKVQGDGPLAFRPDGTPLLLSSVDKDPTTLVLFDLTREIELRRFSSPDPVRPQMVAFAITPSGSHVAALCQALGKKDRDVQPDPRGLAAVWDTATGTVVRSIEHALPVTGLALSPDGSLMAVGDAEGTVAIWILPGGELYAKLSASDNRINCLSFGRDPRVSFRHAPNTPRWQLAVGDAGGIVTFLDLQTKRIRNVGRGSPYDIKVLVFSPDGTWLLSAGRSTAKLWDVATGRLVLDIPAGNTMLAVACAPDGQTLAIGCWGMFGSPDRVRVMRLSEGRGMRTLAGLASNIERVVCSHDGRLIAALADEWTVGIWERESGRLRHLLGMPPGEFADNAGLAFDAESKRLAFAAHERATLWDLEAGRLLRTWKLPPALQDRPSFHGPDQLMLFRVETKDRVAPFNHNRPEGHPRVYRLYNLLSPTPEIPIREISDHNLGCFGSTAPDDGRFVIADGIGGAPDQPVRTFNAYDVLTGALLWSMPAHVKWNAYDGQLTDVDPTGSILLLKTPRQPSIGLRLPSREWLGEFPESVRLAPSASSWMENYVQPEDAIFELRFHPNGRDEPVVPFLEPGQVVGLVFTPDSHHIAWGSPDRTVAVCDLIEVQQALAGFGLGW